MKLDPSTTCGSSSNTQASGEPCNALVMVGGVFEATDDWVPSATEKPLFAATLAGWSSSCEPVQQGSRSCDADGVCSSGSTDNNSTSTEAPTSPQSLMEHGISMLESLKSGAKLASAQMPPCLVKGIDSSYMASLVLLPPVKFALVGGVRVNNSRTTAAPRLAALQQDAAAPPAVFADSSSVFSLTVELLDEGGEVVTVHSRSTVRVDSVQASATLPDALKPQVVGGSAVLLSEGRATLSDLTVRARPGNITLTLVVDLLPDFRLTVNLTVLPCPVDTVPSSSGLQCDPCREDSFALWSATEATEEQAQQGWLAYTNTTLKDGTTLAPSLLDRGGDNPALRCYTCPTGASCPAGVATFVPRPGYWSSHPYNPITHRCILKEACRDGDAAGWCP